MKKGLIFALVIGIGLSLYPQVSFGQQLDAQVEDNKEIICEIAQESNGIGKLNQALKNMGFNNFNEMNRFMGKTNNGIDNRCH